MKRNIIVCIAVLAAALCSCGTKKSADTCLDRAKEVMDSIYAHYGVAECCLLRENFPFNIDYRAGYLASEDKAQPNPYSYLWPFSGTLSAGAAIMEHDKSYEKIVKERILPGLYEYLDESREPSAYSSYINSAPLSDRFYDDNIWLGIDFCGLYSLSGDKAYLSEAQRIWKFIESGTDEVLGGGIYWCEQQKTSKNTCSNAPGTVLAMKLYKATSDIQYLESAKNLYAWTKNTLLDKSDSLYLDNIGLDGEIKEWKFAYNSGQMVQAGVLLYNATGDASYLTDARNTAKACHGYFFEPFETEDGENFRLLTKGNVWFQAVMVRGLVELYNVDGNPAYLQDVRKSLDYVWNHGRSEQGLFSNDFSGKEIKSEKWLLTQAAIAEILARLHNLGDLVR